MTPHPASPAEPPAPPAVDISSKAVAARVAYRREFSPEWDLTHLFEALAAGRDRLSEERDRFLELASIRDARDAEMQELMRINNETVADRDRDRLRTFVRSARGIIQEYAREHPEHVWEGHGIDPMDARVWLIIESAEIGTARDGGESKVEGRTR